MTTLAVETLAPLATLPYQRGAETLVIPLGADAGGAITIPPYDFKDYRARHVADPPLPRYVVAPLAPIGRDALAVEFDFSLGGAGVGGTVRVEIPAGTAAGPSFAIPLPDGAGAELRLLRFRQKPQPLPGGASSWRLVALLGNLAKLLWILGRENEEIRAQLGDVRRQRVLKVARDSSLDLHGRDLRVPRFPAREHSFDSSTLALYHLNEHPVADGGDVTDETKRFGLAGHTAKNIAATSGTGGKFGFGFHVPGPSGSGRLEIPHHGDFNVAANADFTVELFAQISPGGPGPSVLAVKGTVDAAGELTAGGWSLMTGELRGIPGNVRWMLRSGGVISSAFADLNLADGAFHHLAGTLDRSAGRARLFVDGILRASTDASTLGPVSNGAPILIGRSAAGHQTNATLDELRLSSVARTDFHPVLGEGDAAYRKRLQIFKRWLLPTPRALLAALNDAVSPIAGDPAPFILVEKDRPVATVTQLARVVPTVLAAGAHIDRDGNPRSSVDEACGRAEDESGFQDAFLARHDRPEVLYAGESARRMQVPAAAALDALIQRLADAAIAGRVILDRSFDPQGPGLHRVGRALLMRHESASVSQLAALGHRAGFDFVEARPGAVFAAVAAGPQLEVASAALPAAEPPWAADVFVGAGLDLTLSPESLPAAGRFEWTIVRCGPGRAHLAPHPADPATTKTPLRARRRVRLVADAAGIVTVTVEYRLRSITVNGSRTFRVAPASLAASNHIAGDGDTTMTEAAAVGATESDFDAIYLVTSALPATFGPGPDTRRMQVALERRLERLIALTVPAPPAQLEVRRAFVAGDPGLAGVGRALLVRHAAIAAGRLAALAHEAGFGYVERRGADVYASIALAEKIEIVRVADGAPLPDELAAGTAIAVEVRPKPLPAGGSFNWSVDRIGRGTARLAPVLRAASVLTPVEPGVLGVNVLYLAQDARATPPYTFEVRLKPALEAAGAIVPKPEYDLVMNVLNFFHPIGVEVLTRPLRERVVEVRDNLLNAFPGYTYPDFRVDPRTAPRRP